MKNILMACLLVISISSFSQNISFIVDGGYSKRLFLIDDSASDSYAAYLKAKKLGNNFGAEIIYFNEGHGIGFKFSTFLNSVTGKSLEIGDYSHVSMNEKIRINYFSLQYHWRNQIKQLPFYYEMVLGLGLVRYKSTGKEYDEKMEILSKTYGMNASVLLEYAIIKNFSIGTSAGFMMAKIGEATRNGYTFNYNPYESLSRIDLNLFTRLNF